MRNLHIWLFGFLFVWLDDFQAYHFYMGNLLYKLVRFCTIIIVGILPYYFVRFTWYRILIYFVDSKYKYIPIDLEQLINDAKLNDVECELHDTYETNQLDQ